MRQGRLIPLVCALSALGAPAVAQAADEFRTLFEDYRDNGRIDGCYKPAHLHNASRQIPPDVEQYAPGFGDALARAQGACSKPGAAGDGAPGAVGAISAGTAAPGTPAHAKRRGVRKPPAPERTRDPVLASLPTPSLEGGAAVATSSDVPGGLIALAIAAGLALLLALAWLVAWFMGWSPERFTRPVTAAVGSVFSRR